jgi:hypothetical protein
MVGSPFFIHAEVRVMDGSAVCVCGCSGSGHSARGSYDGMHFAV